MDTTANDDAHKPGRKGAKREATVTSLEDAPRRKRGRPRKTEAEKAATRAAREQRNREKGASGKNGLTEASSPAVKKLTDRQRRILEFIRDYRTIQGYPPSIREIANSVGLQSTSSVSYHLAQLEERGFLRREDKKPRAFDISGFEGSSEDLSARPKPGKRSKPLPTTQSDQLPEATYVPVVGQIAAGAPITAEQNVEAHFPLPAELVGSGELFLVQVVGESMQDAGIFNGDWVVVRSQSQAELGDFVAAMIDGEATVKEFHRDADGVWLLPHNELFEPIPAEEAQILGKVAAVLRKI